MAFPVILVVTGGAEVGRASLEVGYPAGPFAFLTAVPSGAAAAAGAGVSSSVRDSGAAGEKVVALEVTAPAPFPQGTLLNLQFQVAHDIALDQEFRIRNLARSAAGLDGKPVETFGIDGSITILAPVAACFFYMH